MHFHFVKRPQFSWVTEQLIARLEQAFRERNLDPEKHLMVIPWLSLEKFQTLLDLCDIYLDCPSFSVTPRMAGGSSRDTGGHAAGQVHAPAPGGRIVAQDRGDRHHRRLHR